MHFGATLWADRDQWLRSWMFSVVDGEMQSCDWKIDTSVTTNHNTLLTE